MEETQNSIEVMSYLVLLVPLIFCIIGMHNSQNEKYIDNNQESDRRLRKIKLLRRYGIIERSYVKKINSDKVYKLRPINESLLLHDDYVLVEDLDDVIYDKNIMSYVPKTYSICIHELEPVYRYSKNEYSKNEKDYIKNNSSNVHIENFIYIENYTTK